MAGGVTPEEMGTGHPPADWAIAAMGPVLLVSLWLPWDRQVDALQDQAGFEGGYATAAIGAAVLGLALAAEVLLRRALRLGLPTTVFGFGRGQIQLALATVTVGLVLGRYLYLRDIARWGIYVALLASLVLTAAAWALRPTTPVRPPALLHFGERAMVGAAVAAVAVVWMGWYTGLNADGFPVPVNGWADPNRGLSITSTTLAAWLLVEWAVAASGSPLPRWRRWSWFRHVQLAAAVISFGAVTLKYALDSEARLAGVYLAMCAGAVLTFGAAWVWALGDTGAARAEADLAEARPFEPAAPTPTGQAATPPTPPRPPPPPSPPPAAPRPGSLTDAAEPF